MTTAAESSLQDQSPVEAASTTQAGNAAAEKSKKVTSKHVKAQVLDLATVKERRDALARKIAALKVKDLTLRDSQAAATRRKQSRQDLIIGAWLRAKDPATYDAVCARLTREQDVDAFIDTPTAVQRAVARDKAVREKAARMTERRAKLLDGGQVGSAPPPPPPPPQNAAEDNAVDEGDRDSTLAR